jgi:hypothetical protein
MRAFFQIILVAMGLLASLPAAMRSNIDEHQFLDNLRQEMAPVVFSGPLSLANLNLNLSGSVVAAQPGEQLFGMLNFEYDKTTLDPDTLNQIVIGFEEMGAQKCIFNEPSYRCAEGITSFFLNVPSEPGLYEVQCRFEQANNPIEAISSWDTSEVMVIGKVLVREHRGMCDD